MKLKLVILTEIIAPYRIPVFNELAQHPEIDLHVIFLAETDPTQRQWRVYKDEIKFSYEVLPSWRLRLSRYHCLLNWGVRKALRRTRPDAVICGGYNYLASWIALRWANRRNIPFLLWMESTARDRRRGHALVESLKTNFIRRCWGFVVAGKSSREYVRSFGIRPGRIFDAPDAVDSLFFMREVENTRRRALQERQLLALPTHYFLFVGRLIREKGVVDLLDAYAELPSELRPEWGLVYVGTGDFESDLRNRAATLKLESIQFRGFAQREELACYYALADIFVFPTHSDPWGLVVNEAMASGLPVIVSEAAGCAADLVKDGWNGHLVRAGDIHQLAQAMQTLAQNPELRREMSTRSQEQIAGYSPAHCAAGIASAILASRSHA